jgi:hypothetical protein
LPPHHLWTAFGWTGLWLAGVIVASIGYRLSRGKPILFFTVKGAQFIEWTASGRAHRPWWRAMAGANNCLVVAVARGRLTVRPFFPFTLMFLPEICGLDVDVPLEQISKVYEDPGVFRTRVRVTFRTGGGDRGELSLYLRRPQEFLHLLSPRAS